MMADLYWDEVLLTNNPDSKELEVSFKKIDGDGFLLSQGDEPGTNGGVTESDDGSQPPTDDEGDFEEDTDNDIGGGEPIPTEEPPVECQPGNDCEARWDFSELDQDNVGRDSALLLREGYAEEGTSYFGYFSNSSEVKAGARPSNAFELRNQSGTVIFDGNADSRLPTMGGEQSPIIALNNVLADPILKYETPASPDNVDDANRNANTWFWGRRKWADLDPACEGFFCAPPFKSMFNLSRATTTGSIWEDTAEVYDPPNTPNSSKWVGEGANTDGAIQRNESWISIFCTRPYQNATPLDEIIPPTSTSWPEVTVRHQGPVWTYTSNGVSGNTQFRAAGFTPTSQVEIRDNGEVWYRGASGNGGIQWFKSKYGGLDSFMDPLVRDLDGWFTVHDEQYISAARKLTNESGDYGIYDNGVTILQQSFATWYYNGKQITPRFLTSQFTRPTAATGPTFVAHDPLVPIHEYLEISDASQRPSYGTVNPYEEEGFPAWFVGLSLASWISKPISVSSKWDPNFIDDPFVNGSLNVNYTSNQASIQQADCGGTYDLPVLAYVEHSEEGRSFMRSAAFNNLIKAHPRTVVPDYCTRIP